MTDLIDRSIPELARGLRDGTVKAEALAEAAIARHDRYGQKLNAYKLWKPDAAKRSARAASMLFKNGVDLGPMQGIPVSIKDLFAANGWPTFAGTPRRMPREYEVEGPVVAALRAQQAVFPGKTHTVEFAYGGIGSNIHWGTPRNPWDAKQHRVPGGSSSGAGVSLCEGSAWIALGTDTGGSVRIPASLTGTVGIKTSIGRWSRDGIVPLSPIFDTPGILARSVGDAAVAFAVIDPHTKTPPAPRDVAGLRIGVCERLFFEDCGPGIVEGVQRSLKELAKAGAKVTKFDLPSLRPVYECFRQGGVVSVEFYEFLQAKLPEWLKTLDPMVVQRFIKAREMTATEFLRRCRLFNEAAQVAAERMASIDVMVAPTIAIAAPTLKEVSTVEGYAPNNLKVLRNTSIGNLMSMCAITMPVALDKKRMPVGLQLMAPCGHDERLLGIALGFERVLGNARSRIGRPPMCR